MMYSNDAKKTLATAQTCNRLWRYDDRPKNKGFEISREELAELVREFKQRNTTTPKQD